MGNEQIFDGLVFVIDEILLKVQWTTNPRCSMTRPINFHLGRRSATQQQARPDSTRIGYVVPKGQNARAMILTLTNWAGKLPMLSKNVDRCSLNTLI